MRWLLVLHAALAVIAAPMGRRLGTRALLVCALAPVVTLAWAGWHSREVIAGRPLEESNAWVPGLHLDLTFRLDAFSLLMVLIVAGVGLLVLVYSAGYLDETASPGRFAAIMVAFAGAMIGLVLADNLFLLYACWELTSLASYALIAHQDQSRTARSAALQSLLVTTTGGFAMLAGLVVLGQRSGSYTLSALAAHPPPLDGAVTAALLLVLAGALTKSAQVPAHGWLPAAMVAPTPVSAYLHAAAMVKAGVYLVARLGPVFAVAAAWRWPVLVCGLASLLLGGWQALRERDLKLILAGGTIAQLGLMIVLLGSGQPAAMGAGLALLVAHAAFKGALFLVAGAVDKSADTRDLALLGGLGRRLPGLAVVAVLAAASMAGIPPLLGFVAKEASLAAFTGATLATVVVGGTLTVAYAIRFTWRPFLAGPGAPAGGGGGGVAMTGSGGPSGAGGTSWTGGAVGVPGPPEVSKPGWLLFLPPAVLALAGLVLGVAPGLLSPLLDAALRALVPGAPPIGLAVWHGLNLPLGLSALTIAAGVTAFAVSERGVWPRRRLPPAPEVGRAAVRGVVIACARVTGVLEPGSLPIYLTVTVLTAVGLPTAALLWRWPGASRPPLAESPLQVVVAAMVVVASVAVARARRRLGAALLLSTVGYGVAALFVIHGAPDLALVQFLVETVSVILFVLVFRAMPERFRPQPMRGALPRAAVAVVVGVFAAGFAVLAASARAEPTVSRFYLARALPDLGARNVVDTIITDFRALDTLGEISVLAIAALGVVNLVVVGRPPRRPGVVAGWFSTSTVFRSTARFVFPTLLLVSLLLVTVGHDAPGGGFAGGLVAGSALLLRYLAGGGGEARRALRVRPVPLLASGLGVAVVAAASSWAEGRPLLTHAELDLRVGAVGELHLPLSLGFELGVYLVVLGFVLISLRTAGGEEVPSAAAEPGGAGAGAEGGAPAVGANREAGP
jgi:multicomponent Na+:H+ antiporter subunit A